MQQMNDLVRHRFNYEGIDLEIDNFAREQVLNTTLAADHVWEPWQLNVMRRVIRPDSVCVDAGANVGVNALDDSTLAMKA